MKQLISEFGTSTESHQPSLCTPVHSLFLTHRPAGPHTKSQSFTHTLLWKSFLWNKNADLQCWMLKHWPKVHRIAHELKFLWKYGGCLPHILHHFERTDARARAHAHAHAHAEDKHIHAWFLSHSYRGHMQTHTLSLISSPAKRD